jgi:GNAT superfamily N-acetyltransferase
MSQGPGGASGADQKTPGGASGADQKTPGGASGADQKTPGGPLAVLLAEVAAGRYPPADGSVTILPQPSPREAGVLAFTAHSVIFTDVDPGWVRGRLAPGDLAAPVLPSFLEALCAKTGHQANCADMLCVATAAPGPPDIALSPARAASHPRVARALRYRDDVRAWEVPGGILTLGRGVAGRWEVAVEVDPDHRGRGLGRGLAAAARHLVPGGIPLWAQITPGNAASVRAFLAAGYRPVGSEILLRAVTG